MSSLIILTAIVVASIIAAVVCLMKLKPDLSRPYWFQAAGVTLIFMAVLSGLAWYNLFFYACVSFVIIMAVREASKYVFLKSKGGPVLGVYFGLWLSLPVGMLQFST